MVVSDSVFDVLLFGALFVAVLLDFFLPQVFHGVATALVLAAFCYSAARDMAFGFSRRGVWSQESLATSAALCALGAIFYFGFNDADIVLVVVSIGLMMASLMALIALVACVGACFHERSAAPIAGLLLTIFGALALGIGAGLLLLVLVSSPLPLRLGVLAVGAVAWKLRGLLIRPTSRTTPVSNTEIGVTSSAISHSNTTNSNAMASNATATTSTRSNDALAPFHRNWLSPQGGTVLDRIVPVFVVGALAFVVLAQTRRGTLEPTSPAQATNAQAQTSQASSP